MTPSVESASLKIRSNCSDDFFIPPETRQPQVSGANKPSPVTAVLTGPNVLGSCDSLVLSALGTQGAGSGPLKYTWMVMAPESVDSDMNSVKHSLASHDAPTLELGPGVLPAGYTFVFSVRVTSIWGSRDTATLTVETERQPTRPSVHMQGPSVEYIDASQDLTLEGDASIPGSGCTGTSSMPSRSIGFEWSVVPEIYFHPTMRKVRPRGSTAITSHRTLSATAL